MTILKEQIILLSLIFSSELFEQFYQTSLKDLFTTLKNYYYNYYLLLNFLKFIWRNVSEYILQERNTFSVFIKFTFNSMCFHFFFFQFEFSI